MPGRDYFLKQAETCLRLAQGLTDGDVAQRLRSLAAEYQAKSEQAESDPTDNPDNEDK